METVKGIDLSHLDNPVSWKDISPEIKFVFVKATQGGTYKDPIFDKYWQILKATTLIRGTYIFWDYRFTAQQHWDNIAQLGIDFFKQGVLPLVVDIENQSTKKNPDADKWVINHKEECVASITELLNIIKVNTGRDAIVYSDPSYFKDYLGGVSWPNSPLWLAAIQPKAPKPIAGYSKVTFWQNSWYGLINGKLRGGHMDMDIFLGSLQELKQLANY